MWHGFPVSVGEIRETKTDSSENFEKEQWKWILCIFSKESNINQVRQIGFGVLTNGVATYSFIFWHF